MRKWGYLFMMLLVSCGTKTATINNLYTDLHLKTRQEHIDLVEHCSPAIDTMLQTMINILEQNEDQEECLRTWHMTSSFIKESRIKNQIYVHQVILTDDTYPIASKMWDSHDRMIDLESDLGLDIEKAIRSNDRIRAVQRLKDLQRLIGNEWKETLKQAKEYKNVVFEKKK